MNEDRSLKIENRIREILSLYIERESNKSALITITRVELRAKGREATIYLSVMPEAGEESALNFLKRKRKEMKEYLTDHLPIHPIPFLDVEIDQGEKARNNIEALLKQDN